MLISKSACSFAAVFIYAFYCIAGISNSHGLTVEQANSCYSCFILDKSSSRRWCAGDGYIGCILTAVSSCPQGTLWYGAVSNHYFCPYPLDFANCKGCIAADKTWCVFKILHLSVEENKCIQRVDDDKLWKGHFDCPNGNIYNTCVRTKSDDVVPADADLDSLPIVRYCSECISESSTGWCVSRNLSIGNFSYDVNYCLPTLEERKCKGTFFTRNGKNSGCPNDSGRFVLRFKLNEVARADHHSLPKTCSLCKAGSDRWCIRSEGSGKTAVSVRLCVSAFDACPAGSTESLTCVDPSIPTFYSHLPEVPRNLPDKCSKCTGENAWCDSSSVRVCLPKWSFGYLCSSAVSCSFDNENRLFVDHPFYLPQTCEGCVKKGVGKWCITKYQFCVPSAAENLCVGATANMNCNDLKSGEKKALIPVLIPKNCDECVENSDFSWCVNLNFGEKIKVCLANDAVKTFCKDGVALRHCQIAPEDKVMSVGLFAPEELGVTASQGKGVTETVEKGITETEEKRVTETEEKGITKTEEKGITETEEKGITGTEDKVVTASRKKGITTLQDKRTIVFKNNLMQNYINDSPAFASLSLTAASVVVLIEFTFF